ncbi:MAG TPA: adenylate/guanylate cyclase domain-containing protein [Candidatus Limnocylindrales bacterium]|nr:adenylate/guanylate cyclase domain-containing protein [Candidatus Limnocylindrales bacterium]
MRRLLHKSLESPDERVEHARLLMQTLSLGDVTVARQVMKPGWRWSVDVRPLVGGEWCQARHVGVVLSGRFGVLMDDGAEAAIGSNEVYVLPPGHDGYVIGDEPVVVLEWSGVRGWIPDLESLSQRVLATVVLTDIVDSTTTAAGLGDRRWREVLAGHNERTRDLLQLYRGLEINTTGDGFLAVFDGAARAVRCAVELARPHEDDGLRLRAAVHTGEIEKVGEDVRGLAIHEAARMLALAGHGEVLVSSLTRELAGAAGLHFEDRGEHELRGIEGGRRLYAVTMRQ